MMKFLFIFLFIASTAFSQTPKYIIGKVLDQETGQGVSNASVINKRSLAVGRTNQLGNYYLQIKPGDSVVVTSPTHGRKAFRWDGNTQQPTIRMRRELADNVVNLAEVTVRGKQEAELKRELEQLLSEPEAKRGVSAEQVLDRAASGSVITLLYEAFSRRAKADRKVLVLMQEDRRHKLALYRFDLVASRATDLTGDELDKFREFCQFEDMTILQASEYELTFAILQHLKAFKR
jgi:hypothetical protein